MNSFYWIFSSPSTSILYFTSNIGKHFNSSKIIVLSDSYKKLKYSFFSSADCLKNSTKLGNFFYFLSLLDKLDRLKKLNYYKKAEIISL